MTDDEIHALQDRLRPYCGVRPISPAARARFLHVTDPDNARDLALDYDEDHR